MYIFRHSCSVVSGPSCDASSSLTATGLHQVTSSPSSTPMTMTHLDSRALSALALPITVPISTPSSELPLPGYLPHEPLHEPTFSPTILNFVRSPVRQSHVPGPTLRNQPIKATQIIQQPGRNTCALLPRCDQLMIPERLTSPLVWTGCMVRSTMIRLPGPVHQSFSNMIKSKSVPLQRGS